METGLVVERLTLTGGILYGRSIRPGGLHASEVLSADACIIGASPVNWAYPMKGEMKPSGCSGKTLRRR